MWTPRRIVLLAFGFVLFLTLYVGYAYTFIGRIDGLPPLPEAYHRPEGERPPLPPPGSHRTLLETRLVQAFGPDCPELSRAIRLDLHAKSMVLSAAQFQVLPDGRVCLTPISVALFGKDRNDRRGVEVNTIRAQVAYLKFDRPISNMNPQEMGARKIVEAELSGSIEVVNNRRTLARDDDLVVSIATGPLYFNEERHLIWTHDHIKLLDHKSQPKPTDIRGKGMEMYLQVEAPTPPQPGVWPPRPPRGESISGVRRIVLTSNVDMHLYNSRSGFLGGAKDTGTKAAPAADEKAHISIRTPGRFQYDLFKDHDLATFDAPPADPAQPSRLPHDVQVIRHHDRLGTSDQLVCQRLVLRLRRREGVVRPGGGPPAGGDQGVEIETAHATGKEVTLTSDTEKLRANGNDFFYDAVRQLTVLKGEPEMEADKDGSLIHAREMQIRDVKEPDGPGGTGKVRQEVTALGPGSIHLHDKKSDKKTVHAFWNDTLTSTKDGPLDLLVFKGAARFVDDEHDQTLRAEVLKVWLNAGAQESRDGEKATAAPQQARRPQHLEATGNVLARSREMHVHDTGRLVVWFKDVPPGSVLPTAPREGPGKGEPEAKGKGGAVVTGQPAPPGPPSEDRHNPPPAEAKRPDGEAPAPDEKPAPPALSLLAEGAGARGTDAKAKKTDEPARPIDLSARSVEAWVLRSEEKNAIDKLWTEGSVHVRQDPAKPEDKGVDIKGDTLEMTSRQGGNFLVVRGDLAQLRMDKIYILGPEVNIDQASNKAWVYGVGAMQMDSDQNFQGARLNRTVPLTIHWNERMFFNGESAVFEGGIVADQENSNLACQVLQVMFDRPISLKEGSRGDQPSRVRNLVCDKSVRVEDSTLDNGRLVKYQRIESIALQMNTIPLDEDDPRRRDKNSDGNEVRVSGPGSVRILQRGAADPLAAPAAGDRTAPRPAAPADETMKMTYVLFRKHMNANSKTNTANFYENVRVLNFLCEDPNAEIDMDALLKDGLPEGALYLSCERLKVLDQQTDGRSNQQMEAYGRVYVEGREFYARADSVFYNQAKDQVIFDGNESGQATLYKVVRRGIEPQRLTGRKIIYNRVTGDARVIEGKSLIGGQ